MADAGAHFERDQRSALDQGAASSLHADEAPTNGATAADGSDAPWVLVVEDEALINLELCDALVDAGYQVMGPAMTLTGALFLLQLQTPQLAIVDVLLRDGPCTELVQQLRTRGVPFFVHSGYGRHASAMEGFEGAPWLAKPAPREDIVKLLRQLAEAGR